MKVEAAIQYLQSKHVAMNEKVKENLINALQLLDEEKGFLDSFNKENLEALYKIEMINPSYFPGISRAASENILNLHGIDFVISLRFASIIFSIEQFFSKGNR